jgi:Leucine-rich repeat (LRR) protein
LPENIGNLIHLERLDCFCNQLQEFPESIGKLNNIGQLFCHSNNFNNSLKNIMEKYDFDYYRFSFNAQQILQELRDAYLIPTDNSYVLK